MLAIGLSLFVVLGRKLGWKSFVLVGAAAYFAASPWTGQRYDIFFVLSSGIRILQHVNPFAPGIPPVYPGSLKWAYPPLYPAYSAVSFLIFQALTGASLPSISSLTYPGWYTAIYNSYEAYVPANLPVLVFLLKLPVIAAALATGLLLKKMSGNERVAVSWVANPLVILIGVVWGELDPIATLLALASLYYFERGLGYRAYLLASLGAAVKVWPALLIPIYLVVAFRTKGLSSLKPLAAILPPILVSLGIYMVYENPIQSLYLLGYARLVPTFNGAFSVNGLTWQQILFAARAPPVPLFLWVGVPLYLVILGWAYWRRETDVVTILIKFILIFYLTYNYVNPQYLYWILPFLLLKGRRIAYVALTLLPLVYVAFSYNLFYFVSPALLPDLYGFGASILEQLKVSFFYDSFVVFVLVAGVLPTIAFLWFLRAEFDGSRSGLMPASPVVDSEDIMNKAN
jgi:hypothetical protein